ncbi:MAG: IS1595 family transposase, partial [Bacteroidetes bacterium]|nr:IS1595 family transposase [Bacteroidota bacterium]
YRINRSQSKETIFNNLIMRMVSAEHISYSQILCS